MPFRFVCLLVCLSDKAYTPAPDTPTLCTRPAELLPDYPGQVQALCARLGQAVNQWGGAGATHPPLAVSVHSGRDYEGGGGQWGTHWLQRLGIELLMTKCVG